MATGVIDPMKYDIQFKPGAVKDVKSMPTRIQARVLARIEEMSDNLKDDVKRLTGFTREYRLRVGDYRVLFEIEGKSIVVYRVRHRREAYR
jgi:mRNA interferase RelE/StbE